MPYRHNLPSPSTLMGAHSDSGPTHTDVAHQGIFTPDHLEDQTCFKETLASISLKHIAQAPMRFICPFYNRWDDRIVYASIVFFSSAFLVPYFFIQWQNFICMRAEACLWPINPHLESSHEGK